ncbi:MAG: hypothetical protein BJ554DRAFT_1563 [Olpidium bornovanus]|uniref:Uncharacterized protein n=1 Tax=Olpidium bornovanus TaxID=278681 RepID=A0A8H7ZRV7_9FUNG|nr:MAG: hypothetical protein BJ554DRAFT_1563 [Olpidium bornovanus]
MQEILDITEEDARFLLKADTLEVFENVVDLSLASRIGSLKEKTNLIPHPAFTAARSRSNLFERVGKSIFINRSAVKLAGLDAVYGLTGRKSGLPSDAPVRNGARVVGHQSATWSSTLKGQICCLAVPFRGHLWRTGSSRYLDKSAEANFVTAVEYLLWRKHSAGEVETAAVGHGAWKSANVPSNAAFIADLLCAGDITSSETIRSVVEHIHLRAADGVDLAVADGVWIVLPVARAVRGEARPLTALAYQGVRHASRQGASAGVLDAAVDTLRGSDHVLRAPPGRRFRGEVVRRANPFHGGTPVHPLHVFRAHIDHQTLHVAPGEFREVSAVSDFRLNADAPPQLQVERASVVNGHDDRVLVDPSDFFFSFFPAVARFFLCLTPSKIRCLRRLAEKKAGARY